MFHIFNSTRSCFIDVLTIAPISIIIWPLEAIDVLTIATISIEDIA